MKLYNTLSRTVEDFKPLADKQVKLYTCGPTVYDYQHIGNYSGYIYWDILVRLLKYEGFEVDRIMNITDVGHLVSDEDEGEDKLEKGAHREGKTVREVAELYTQDFFEGMESLKLLKPKYAKATDYIDQQVEMVKILTDKGFAYQTEQAIYFDVAKLDSYGRLTGQKLSEKETAARAEVITDSSKRNPQDFALWFFTVGRFKDHEMRWPSPWGEGFPGWHLECSAIIHAELGDPIDIHTGGIDHIGTHHTNEMAQTEAAYGNQLADYWVHNNHLMVEGKKISKSLGNGFTLKDLAKKGFSPADFKLFVLQSHYRHQSNFSWENLEAAKNRLQVYGSMADLRFQPIKFSSASSYDFEAVAKELTKALKDDLNTPAALSILSKLSDELHVISTDQVDSFNELLKTIDALLGLELSQSSDITGQQKEIIKNREQARAKKDFSESDNLREELAGQGIGLNDSGHGSTWYRI